MDLKNEKLTANASVILGNKSNAFAAATPLQQSGHIFVTVVELIISSVHIPVNSSIFAT